MPEKSLHDLFLEELKDMYDGEKRLTRALPKMAKAASAPELQSAFASHLRETERQVTRLERVFKGLGEKPRGKTCHGIMGIVEEGSKAMQELERGPILDAALIAGAQKVEHYEIASYGTLAYFASIMAHQQAKDLLGETLDEEKAADAKLNTIAKSKVNRQALRGRHASGDEEGIFAMARRGTRRAGAALALAHDRPARTRASKPSAARTSSRRRSSGRTATAKKR